MTALLLVRTASQLDVQADRCFDPIVGRDPSQAPAPGGLLVSRRSDHLAAAGASSPLLKTERRGARFARSRSESERR